MKDDLGQLGKQEEDRLTNVECIREALALTDQEKILRMMETLQARNIDPGSIEDPRIEVVLRDLARIQYPSWRQNHLRKLLDKGIDVAKRLTVEEVDFLGGFDLSDAKKEDVARKKFSPVLKNVLRIPSLREMPHLSQEQKRKLLNMAYVNVCFEYIDSTDSPGVFPLTLEELAMVLAKEGMEREALELLLQNEVDRMRYLPGLNFEELDLAITREVRE
jgi:hypothetical protein